MKFGKTLSKVVHMSDPEWAPYFINYKFLKKRIKTIKVKESGPLLTADDSAAAIQANLTADGTHSSAPGGIEQSIGEKDFFRALHFELQKASKFFVSAEKEMVMRHERIQEGARQLSERITVTDEDFGQMIMAACLKLYKDLLMLENFAIMTYLGFAKILKKHDKNSGFVTKDKFMAKLITPQPFTKCERLKNLIQESESLFQEIASLCRDAPNTKLTLQTEQRLFLEAIMDLKTAASTMYTQEDMSSDSGDNGDAGDSVNGDDDDNDSDEDGVDGSAELCSGRRSMSCDPVGAKLAPGPSCKRRKVHASDHPSQGE